MVTNIVATEYAADPSKTIKEYNKLAWQRYLATLFVERASSAKYGEGTTFIRSWSISKDFG